MIHAIKNWLFKRWVLNRVLDPMILSLTAMVDRGQNDQFFYHAKKQIRFRAEAVGFSPDLIEIAEGTLTIVKGRCVARVEV